MGNCLTLMNEVRWDEMGCGGVWCDVMLVAQYLAGVSMRTLRHLSGSELSKHTHRVKSS